MRINVRATHLTTIAALLAGQALQAQGMSSTDKPRSPRVVVDRNSAAIGSVLPFDEPFVLTGAAGANLLKLQVWYADSVILKPKDCAAQTTPAATIAASDRRNIFGVHPVVKLQYADWTRIRPGAADSFWVSVSHPLPPNRNYTFCLRSTEAPSADDSLRFQTLATAAIRQEIDNAFMGSATSFTTAELISFQRALIAALPPSTATRTVDIARGSIFDSTASGPELVDIFAALRLNDRDRRLRAVAVAREHDAAAPNRASLRTSIETLAASVLIDRLAHVIVDPPKTGDDQGRRREDAVVLAGTISRLYMQYDAQTREKTCRDIRYEDSRGDGCVDGTLTAAIAIGEVPINSPRSAGTEGVIPSEISAPADVARFAVNLDTTIARLESLADLIRSAPQVEQAKFTRTEVTQLSRLVAATLNLAEQQRINLAEWQQGLVDVETATTKLVTNVAMRDLRSVGYSSTTSGNYETRARWLISQDLGVLYAWANDAQGTAHDASPYFGVNFYVRPVNKRAPLGVINPLDLRRWSVTLGVTTSKIEEKDRYSGIIAGTALVTGAGFRVTDFLRVSYGTSLVWTYSPDADRRKRLTALRYVGASIDADLRELISSIANPLFGK